MNRKTAVLQRPHLLTSSFNHPLLVGSLVISSVIFILYSVAFGHNFLFDEENIIIRNPLIRSFSLVPQLFKHGYFYFEGQPPIDWAQYYRPLTSLTFSVDFQVWRLNPLGYNLTNTLFHCLVCILLFLLLIRILGNKLAAFLAALLYSVHTVHTEAVTYIASRGDLLGAALVLSAILCYWHSRLKTALLFYTLALFAKENSILLPAYLFILDTCFIRSGWRRVIKRLSLFIGMAALYLIFRKYFSPIPLGPPFDNVRAMALRVLSMGGAFLDYLQALVFPDTFKFCLSVPFATHFSSPEVRESVLVIFLLLAAWLLCLKYRGAAFFGISLFLTALLPYAQFIHFYPQWAEHYLYTPAMGLAILLGCLAANVLKTKSKPVLAVFFAVYFSFLFFLGARTWERNKLYNDTEKYYERLAQSDSPYAFFGYQNWARLAMERGDWAEVLVPLKTAEAIEPLSDITHSLLGQYYVKKGLFPEAMAHFQKAYEVSGSNESYLMNVGMVYIHMGRYEDAIEIFEKIQKKSPGSLSVYTNLITSYELAGQPDKAMEAANSGLDILKQKETDYVVLTMAVLRLAYRQGWQDIVREKTEVILQRYPDAFWYGDVARLLAGKTTAMEFLEKVRLEYPVSRSAAKMNVLMSLVLKGQPGEIAEFLEANRADLEKQANSHPLMRKELEKAKEAGGQHTIYS